MTKTRNGPDRLTDRKTDWKRTGCVGKMTGCVKNKPVLCLLLFSELLPALKQGMRTVLYR